MGRLLLALWIFWLVVWIALSRGNKRAAIRINPLWRLLAGVGLVAAYLVLRHFPSVFGLRLLPPSEARLAIGVVLTAAGIGLAIWARLVLGTNWSAAPMIKQDHELIQRGPYRLVRHPIYTGLLLALLGTCGAGGRLWDACLFGLAVAMLVAKLKIEEGLMLRQFPESYPAYRRRTKALVPFVF